MTWGGAAVDGAVHDSAPTPTGAGELGSVHMMVSPSRTRLVLSGEIDVALSPDLTEAITETERIGNPVEVDARHVTFMDSSGVSMLARLAHHTASRLTLIQPPDVVRFLLEVTKIGAIVDVVEVDPGFPESN
ncbi:STAS domain-containing protein [Georgenia sp.]